jgi:alkyldihydroxyacetonephosphate synthase
MPSLPDAVVSLLRDGLGVRSAPGDPSPVTDAELPPSRLGGEDLDALGSVAEIEAGAEARIAHLRGKSTPDLLRVRGHDLAGAPDLVVLPATHDEALAALAICAERRIAVVPFGGGTSVVGGLEPSASGFAGLVALDTQRLNALVALDEESRVATIQPGLRGPEVEELLGERGYTIGHFPQSFEYATVGGFAAARSSGQASAGYGRFDELVVGMRVATPAGELLLGRAPKSAAGPDLRQLFLGSEGAFGVITSLDVTVRPAPERRAYDGWWFPSFAEGAAALRGLAQDGPRPTVLRLSDEVETALNLARPAEIGASGGAGGCLGIVGFEGTADDVESRRAAVSAVLTGLGATADAPAGETWARDRYRGPYLRDALLSAGALVETLETVTFWSGLERLYGAVTSALRDSLTAAGTPPVVLCHVSHVYPAGASLYFTVACAAAEDPLSQWSAAKAAASDAILSAGGSITHHHGVGRDHVPWYEQEIGPLGVAVMRAVKATVDPTGIMNPGVLLPLA